jgi:elongator complex protein 3
MGRSEVLLAPAPPGAGGARAACVAAIADALLRAAATGAEVNIARLKSRAASD